MPTPQEIEMLKRLRIALGGQAASEPALDERAAPISQPAPPPQPQGAMAVDVSQQPTLDRTPTASAPVPPPQQSPARELTALDLQATNQRELAAARNAEAKAMQPNLDAQSQGVQDIQGQIEKLKNSPQQWNIAPILAKVDSDTGTKLAAGYQAPQSPADKAKSMIGLEQALQASRGQLTADQAKQFTALGLGRNATADARLQTGMARLAQQSQLKAQSMFESAQKPNIQRLDGAARIGDIVTSIDSGEVKNNGQLSRLIQAEITRLETGAAQNAQEGIRDSTLSSGIQDLKQRMQYLSDAPQDTVSPENYKQLTTIAKNLSKGYKEAAEGATSRLQGGALPNQIPIIQGMHDAMMKSYDRRLAPLMNRGAAPTQSKPATVVQGGHTYTLNPKTGQYE